ncbi:MAG: pilin [Lachnospiraceae bacterium]|nr:pilin [Lachnospiraceae bacterium]
MTLILTQGRSASAAGGADLSGVTNPIVELLNSFVPYLLALVGAGGAIFCIFLGVKYATAEEPQEREKRKQALKTAIIGYVLIFILIVALRASIGPLTTWMTNASKGQ